MKRFTYVPIELHASIRKFMQINWFDDKQIELNTVYRAK